MGFEPTTIGLENRDSTAELRSQMHPVGFEPTFAGLSGRGFYRDINPVAEPFSYGCVIARIAWI